MQDYVENEPFTLDSKSLQTKLLNVAALLEEAVEEIKTGGEKNKGVGFYTDSGYQNNPDGK